MKYLIICLIAFFMSVSAQAFPNRPIDLIVTMPAGSLGDIVARSLQTGATKAFGQEVVIINKPGATGAIATSYVYNSKPTGYILGSGADVGLIEVPLINKSSYDLLHGLTPILSYGAQGPSALIVRSNSPFKSFDDLRKNVTCGNIGTASATYVISKMIGLKESIPFKGSNEVMLALLGGHVDTASITSDWIPFAKEGRVRPLLIYSEKRVSDFPCIPCLGELGYSYFAKVLYLIYGPAGLDPKVVSILENGFIAATKTPEYKRVFQSMECDTTVIKHKEVVSLLNEKFNSTKQLLKSLGIMED
jgi:tripartite-type tricarboxylate transporter receptor subunit TctC